MIILFFKKLYKFVDRVLPKQVSAVDESSNGLTHIRNAYKAYLDGPAAAIVPQNK